MISFAVAIMISVSVAMEIAWLDQPIIDVNKIFENSRSKQVKSIIFPIVRIKYFLCANVIPIY